MSLAQFAMIQELKAEVTALTARVMVLEARELPKPAPEPKAILRASVTVAGASEPRPTLSLSKRA